MDLDLKDKIAVITGGSQGIGLAVAQGLAAEGVHIALCSRDAGAARQAAAGITQQFGVQAIGSGVDVTQVADTERFLAEISATFDGVDILLNNAGTGSYETIVDAPDERWQYYWDMHVMAAVRVARGLVPQMKKRGGGVIINNASICAAQPIYYEPIYNVTKAALVMLSKCMAHEFMPDKIRVNAVNPGMVLTEPWIAWARSEAAGTDMNWEQFLEEFAKETAPIGRFATPQEIADFIVFLCSPRASYSVGSSYYVDGGWLKVTT
jgi:NAD(P)-dependent dehydrogenase (short-subunit alcohol dehydrogenase family)